MEPASLRREWPGAKVSLWPLDRLKPYAGNSRTHSPAQVAQIADSIEEWGFTTPILAQPNGVIIAGHGRFLAANQLGLDEVPVMVAEGWTPEQVRAYVIADNKLAENAGWDEDLLKIELGELQEAGFDLTLIGFDEEEIARQLAAPAAPAVPNASLAERFGIVPFSVLNAREGWWQDRKGAWLALGIQSEVGRGENQLAFSDTINEPDPAKRAAKATAKAYNDGAQLGKGGLADQVAAKATARKAKEAASG